VCLKEGTGDLGGAHSGEGQRGLRAGCCAAGGGRRKKGPTGGAEQLEEERGRARVLLGRALEGKWAAEKERGMGRGEGNWPVGEERDGPGWAKI
jgi:hypothetical protein